MIDICFPVHNRIEFTRASLRALLNASTERERIIVFVDNDQSGSGGEIRTMLRPWDRIFEGHWDGPVAIMNAFLDVSQTEFWAKVDNDLIVCPWWIDCCLAAMEKQPEFSLVGVEPMDCTPQLGGNWIEESSHIGGIGVFRRAVFDARQRPVPSGRFGFTEWQHHNPEVKKGWITPPLPVFLLDHINFEPWLSLSEKYRSYGWERAIGGRYSQAFQQLWKWWTDTTGVGSGEVSPLPETV